MPNTGKQFALNSFEVDDSGNIDCGTVNGTTQIGNAIGVGASATTGGAIGEGASATTGGAIGVGAFATTGGAVGFGVDTTSGGAVGEGAISTTGGAVGENAQATTGGALGTTAWSLAAGAVQLGSGTNTTTDTLQFLTFPVIDASGDIPAARLVNAARVTSVPASASATGTAGQIAYATGFLYVCIATDTWERVVIATW